MDSERVGRKMEVSMKATMIKDGGLKARSIF